MSSRTRPSSSFEAFRSEFDGADPRLTVLRSVGSTNSYAKSELTRDRSAGVQGVVAWEQPQGRGRRGNSWSSPPGAGVYLSIALPVESASALQTLPMLLPVRVCRELRALGVNDARLKWPNDVLVGGRKLAGLLVEAVSCGAAPGWVVVGIGVNYRLPDGLREGHGAVDLTELLETPPPLGTIVRRLLQPWLDGAADEANDELLRAYGALSIHRPGDRLVCRTASETVTGEFEGFDAQGYLQLRAPGGIRRIAAGEIVER